MTLVYEALEALSILVFLYVGTTCLFAGGMKDDSERFGLRRLRLLTGALECRGHSDSWRDGSYPN